MERKFKVQMKGRLAMWGRPDTGPDKVSYNIPTPGGIRGMIHAILHKNHLEVVPTRVEVLKPIQRVSAPQLLWRASKIGGGVTPPDKNLRDPYSAVYLYDVAYRFFFDAFCDEPHILERLQRNLDEGSFYGTPFFGKRECLAEFDTLTDAPPAVDVTLVEPNLVISNNGQTVRMEVKEGVVDFTPFYDDIRAALRDRRF